MNKFKKVQLMLSLLFVLLALGFLGAEVYLYQVLMESQANITEQQYRIDKIDEREQILSNLSKKYTEIEDATNLINTALPDKKDSSRLMSDLDSLAVESGLKLKLLSSDASTSKKSATDPGLLQTVNGNYGYELPLNISVEGSYSNFQIFIKKVENYQRLISITSIDISQPSIKEDTILAKLKLTAYIKK